MLKKLLTLTLVFAGILTLAACDKTPAGPTDLEKLAEALVEIELPSSTSTDLTFPSTGLHDVTITWESNNTAVIANDGKVTIPLFTQGNKTVKITAFVTLGDNTLTKTFNVSVNAAAVKTDAEKVAEAKAVLLLLDQSVISDMTLVGTALEATVTWSSSNPALIANDGTVVRPDEATGNVVVTLTATLTVGAASDTKTFEVTVVAEEGAMVYTSIATMYDTAVLNDYIEFTGVVTGIFKTGFFVSDGTNALGVYMGSSEWTVAIGDSVKVKGFYKVYNTLYQLSDVVSYEVLSSGNANPLTPTVLTVAELLALDSSVKTIHGMYYTISGTVELRGTYDNVYLVEGDSAVLVYYDSVATSIDALEAQVGKEITITVFYYTNHGTNGPMVAYDGGEAGISINALPDDEALAADVAALETLVPGITLETIVLPTEGPNGTMFSAWTSSDVAVLGNDGAFVALGTTSTTVTFTGTATKGTLTQTVTVEVVVPVNSTVAEVLAMEVGDYFQVTGVIYDISYYGLFIEQGGDYIFIYSKQYAGPAVVGDEVSLLGTRDFYSGLAQIAMISDLTVVSSSNTLPSVVMSTVGALQFDLVPRGTVATVTGMVSIEGSKNDIFITDIAGGKTKVYYRSNASELTSLAGSIVTLDLIAYQDETVLYKGLTADATVVTAYTDAYAAQATIDALDLGNYMMAEMDLVLPTTNTGSAATLVWTTSDAAVVTDAGVITLVPGATPSATLTVVATVGAETATKDFVVTLIDANEVTPLSVSEALLETDDTNVLVVGVVTAVYYENVVLQDEVTGVGVYVKGVGYDHLVGEKLVVRGDLGTATSNGNNQRTLYSSVLIELVSADNALVVSTETDPAVIVTQYADMKVYENVTLVYKGVNPDKTGYYMFDTGTETMKLEISSYWLPNFLDAVAVDESIVASFSIQDVYYNHVRVQSVEVAWTDAQKLDLAVSALDVPATVTADLTLDTVNADYSATIAWASDNAAVTDMGVVTRPATGAGNVAVVLTATVTVGTLSEVVTFNVSVTEMPAPSAWDHTENFSTFVGNGGSYVTVLETFVGDSGFSWDAMQGRKDFAGYEIDGGGIMFRAKDTSTGSLTAASVTGGIGDLTIDILKGFTGAGTRTIEIYVNDVLVGSHTLVGIEVETLTIDGINVEGTFKLEVRAVGADGKQIVVNNLEWTEYSAS